jgi:BirA family transcriptional regulator, biotin operon repressor / biotin---[acetyl-CoA-carboxylase] ligase
MNVPALDRGPRAEGGGQSSDSFGAFDEGSLGDWTVRRYGTVPSTQDIAAGLPAWNAAMAESQSAGRGQWQRSFTSDRGGLYLSAVLPFNGDGAGWRGFALAVGWAVVTAFRAHGIDRLRLRWPNDLMIGDWKVGGILVSQGKADTLCVGLGLNVRNRPWDEDPSLNAVACRLADFVREDQLGTDFLAATLLGAVRTAYVKFSHDGLRGFVEELNQSWGEPKDVRLELAAGAAAGEISGRFRGILPDGDLLLEDPDGKCVAVRSHLVARLHER